MGIHVITPFESTENASAIIENLRPSNVMWWPLAQTQAKFPVENWINPRIAHRISFYDTLNAFLDGGIFDDDMYCFLRSTNKSEQGFFDKIRAIKGDVIICSLRLKDGDELISAPQNCRPLRCELDQLIIRGRILRDHRFENHPLADGAMIEKIQKLHPVQYAHEAFVIPL